MGNAGGSTGFTYSDGKVTDFNKNYSDISAFNFGDVIANQNGYTGLKSNFRWVAGSGNNIYANNDSNITVPTSTLANVTGTVLLAFTTSDITKDSSSNNVSGSNSGCSHDTNNPFSPPIGNDLSGNNNDYVSSGLNFTDVLLDSPSNNWCCLNGLTLGTDGTLSEGNLKLIYGSASTRTTTTATMGVSSGKWYWEVAVNHDGGETIGITGVATYTGTYPGSIANGAGYYGDNGQKYVNGSASNYGATFANNDIISFALDMDNGTLVAYKNNSSQGTLVSSLTGTQFPAMGDGGGTGTTNNVYNFGQDSSFAGTRTAQGNADSNDVGDFFYSPPADFLALCSSNLPQGSISPAGDSLAENNFNIALWTGNGVNNTAITGFSMNPDLLWTKRRSGADNHMIFDSARGAATSRLFPNLTNAEDGNFGSINSFDTDGFTLGNNVGTNQNSFTFVGWGWKAGGETPVKTYKVRVAATGQGNRYQFRNSADSANFNQSQVTLDLQEGGTYTFDLSNSTVDGHPMKFSTTSNGSHGGGTTYSTGVVYKLDGVAVSETAYVSNFNSATSRTVAITVAASAPTLYYFCHYHSAMGGQINTNSTHGSTNFDGSALSVVSANVTAGFSIVKYTGTGSAITVGHNLGVAPSVIILKRRNSADDWLVYHSSRGASAYLTLNSNGIGETGVSYPWNGTSPTSSVFSVNSGGSVSSATMVAYCFHSVSGYSSIGSYVGNGNSANASPFIFTGFRPAWILIKRTDSTTGARWAIFDKKRDVDNVINHTLIADDSLAEDASTVRLDFLSNGVKLRQNGTTINTSGGTYIYLAFAEQPFKYANAR